jgi:hypothetical protein
LLSGQTVTPGPKRTRSRTPFWRLAVQPQRPPRRTQLRSSIPASSTSYSRKDISNSAWCESALDGGEGGIRTPGTLIRGTHDFQSCTFNRSVTSPFHNYNCLPRPPCSSICRCLQNLSKGVGCELGFQTYHGQRRITKLGEAICPTLCREFLASHRTEFSKQNDNIR